LFCDGDTDRREILHDGRAIIRTGLSPFGGDIFIGHQLRGQERGSGGQFWASQIPIFAFDREYRENG